MLVFGQLQEFLLHHQILVEKEIPKELQKIIKQYGGELHTGNIHQHEPSYHESRYPPTTPRDQERVRQIQNFKDTLRKDEASRIVGYDFSKVIDVIKSKGFRLPAIALGAAGLNQQQE